MKIINIARFGRTPIKVMLDDEDILKVKRYRWHRTGLTGISVIRAVINLINTTLPQYLLNYKGPLEIDHIDRNVLNNQKSNLRLATRSQQCINRGLFEGRAIRGVSYNPKANPRNPYTARIQVNKKLIFLGYHKTEKEAALIYDHAALKYFGEFAYLNFPLEK